MSTTLRAFVRSELGFGLLIADFYLMGVIFHLIPRTRPLMAPITPFVLFLLGILLLFLIRRETSPRFYLLFLFLYLFTFAMEAVGVATGLVFGPYSYGAGLGFTILAVPIVIGFNWVLIVLGLYSGLRRVFPDHGFLALLLTAAGAVLFDYFMEPVAIKLDYWSWEGGVIPLQNYGAWFLIALVCASLLRIARIEIRSRLPLYYVCIQGLFFIALNLFLPEALF